MRLEHYNVIFDGKLVQGHHLQKVKQELARLFQMDVRAIEELFAHPPAMIREDVSYKEALKFQILFEKAGAICRLEPHPEKDAPEVDVPKHCKVGHWFC